MNKGEIKKLAEQHNISCNLVYTRLSRGWNLERALTQPKKKVNHTRGCVYLVVTADDRELITNEFQTLKEVAAHFGITESGACMAVIRGNKLRGTNKKIVRCMLDD